SEKGANRISKSLLALDDEIREALEMFAPLARSRRMTLRAELELGLMVEADRDGLRQILLNLLDNAVKYGPAGQTITVGAITAPQVVEEQPVRFWAEDQGPGAPAAERYGAGEPDVRLNRRGESGTGGSGIGLSVVRELVTLQGGRAWVESASAGGGGARVVVELPLHPSTAPPPPPDV